MEKTIMLGDFSTEWIRYSAYRFLEGVQGQLYLIPAEEAVFELYNPFEVADTLLTDLLQMGQTALRGEAAFAQRQLLAFAEHYGLLGLISASVYNRDIMGEEDIVLMQGNSLWQKGTMNAEKYWRLFAPFAEDDELKVYRHKRGFDLRKAEDSPKFYGKRPLVLDLIFSRFYAEEVAWMLDFAKNMVRHFETLQVYQKNATALTEPVTIMPEFFHAEKIGLTITQKVQPQIVWQFDSLKTTAEIIYALVVTEENSLLCQCPHCSKIFMAKSRKEKYCSVSCRNCANVTKSRQRKNEEDEK